MGSRNPQKAENLLASWAIINFSEGHVLLAVIHTVFFVPFHGLVVLCKCLRLFAISYQITPYEINEAHLESNPSEHSSPLILVSHNSLCQPLKRVRHWISRATFCLMTLRTDVCLHNIQIYAL
jgi:hypothetical protein